MPRQSNLLPFPSGTHITSSDFDTTSVLLCTHRTPAPQSTALEAIGEEVYAVRLAFHSPRVTASEAITITVNIAGHPALIEIETHRDCLKWVVDRWAYRQRQVRERRAAIISER